MGSTWRNLISGLVFAGVVLAATERPARAAGEHDTLRANSVSTWEQRRVGVMLHGSLGGPFGWFGASIDYNPLAWLSIEAGGGKGFSGAQWAFEPRVRLPLGASGWGLSLGVGLSGGAYRWKRDLLELDGYPYGYPNSDDGNVIKSWSHAVWTNFTVSGEYRAQNGFQFRAYLGQGVLVNPQDNRCTAFADPSGSRVDSCAAHAGDGEGVPYLGVSVGWSF